MELGILKNSTAYFSNKELDIISYFHYNRITYHRYDRKGLKCQGIDDNFKIK